MRVVALFRVSTERQATDGTSLDAQERIYEQWVNRQGWTTLATFRGAESATQASSDRRVLQQVLAFVRDNDVDAIYVHEQSRLTRGDELEVAMLFRELKERRSKIIVNGVVRDLNSIDERFMVGIQSLVDRAESERIKERLMRGKRHRATEGRKNSGPAPFGYMNPPPGHPKRGTLQVVPEEASIVREIFEMCAAGKGDQAIASILNARGRTASRGGQWGKTSIRRTLTNPAYIGTAASNVWVSKRGARSFRYDPSNPTAVLVPSAHEPIITKELWDAVQSRPRMPRTGTPRMLTGLLWLNGVKAGSDSDHGRRFYRGPRGMARMPWLLADGVDKAVWRAFQELATAPERVEQLMNAALDPQKRELAQQEVKHLQDQVAKLERRLSTLVTMRADDEITKEQFLARSDEARVQLDRVRKDLAEQQKLALTYDSSHAVRVVRAVRALLTGHTRLTVEQQRRILNAIVRRVDVRCVYAKRDFRRDAKGHILPGRSDHWRIEKIALTLALPTSAAADEAVGRSHCDKRPAQNAGTANGCQRGGDVNESDATTYDESRHGQLVLASSCSAPPAPARP